MLANFAQAPCDAVLRTDCFGIGACCAAAAAPVENQEMLADFTQAPCDAVLPLEYWKPVPLGSAPAIYYAVFFEALCVA